MPTRASQDPIVTSAWASGERGRDPAALAELAGRLRERLAPQGWPVPPTALPAGTALVGGAVRDALLGRLAPQPDLDLVVPDGAIALARELAARLGGSCVPLDPERDIARVVLGDWTIDLARCEGKDLESDLRRRDYTANAIALPLESGALPLDPTGGLGDLGRGELVAVSEANLLDDPLRLLRGLRLSWELGLPLQPTSLAWIHRHAGRLEAVAGERVLAELQRLAALAEGQLGLQAVLEAGLLTPWGAAPPPGLDLLALSPGAAAERGLTAAETEQALPLARLAALFDGPALAGLRGSRRLQQRCQQLRRWCEALQPVDHALEALAEGARLELQEQLEEDLPALLLTLPAAAAAAALARWRDPADPLFHPAAPLDGHTLQRCLALPPGPRLGALLRHLRAERAFGRLPEGSELAEARRWLGEAP